MLNIDRHFYKPSYSWLTILLFPLSWIFRFILASRFFLYKLQLKKTIQFNVPILIVGNITVGGTGKTPLVIWLSHFLKKHGYRPGIVSRGVGGKKQKKPCCVNTNSDPQLVGDEAILLAARSDCPVVICVDRVAAVRELLNNKSCDIVIADDGLQHYRLGRDIEIAIVDGDRQFGNGCFLPAGPLRESPQRLQKFDFVITHGEDQTTLAMQLQAKELVAVNNECTQLPLEHFAMQSVHAIAGIGNPARFFASLRSKGLQVIEHIFPDHYLYKSSDFNFNDSLPIIMTEKDAVKCKTFADHRFWYLPVDLKIDAIFQEKLLLKLQNVIKIKNANK